MKSKTTNKEWMLISFATIFLIIGIAVQCITLHSVNKILAKATTQATEESIEVIAEPKITSDTLFRLYECGGKIGIYDAKSDVIIDIIDIFVSTLPQKDRAALKKGIEISSVSDLSEIIEDFST